MPLRMRLGVEDVLRCRFAVSPLCQTHEALRMLRRPERHGYHRAWLRRMQAAVAGLDLARMWLFMPPRGGYTPDFLGAPPEVPSASFADELARMRSTDPAMAHTEMARSLACTPGATESPEGRRALADPARAVRELADLTERAWHALLAPHWSGVRALLEADIAYRSGRLAAGGWEALFADLHPDLAWTDHTLVHHTPHDYPAAQQADGRGVLMVPSVFVWPDVVSGFAAPWQPTVIYPARGVGTLWQDPAAGVTSALVRLVGRTRAAILADLDGPASTTALAARHSMAPSSVSAHLSVLRDAGLLTSRRHGHQVLYERLPLAVALLAAGPAAQG
ncbi:DUF5937 family protein [Streptosporangium soli]|nr:DUF5937 family protein [Streptosporangium sp. KLBMP 9127]